MKSSVPTRYIVNQATVNSAGGISWLIFISRQPLWRRIVSTADKGSLRAEEHRSTDRRTRFGHEVATLGASIRAARVYPLIGALFSVYQRAPLLKARRRVFRTIRSK